MGGHQLQLHRGKERGSAWASGTVFERVSADVRRADEAVRRHRGAKNWISIGGCCTGGTINSIRSIRVSTQEFVTKKMPGFPGVVERTAVARPG